MRKRLIDWGWDLLRLQVATDPVEVMAARVLRRSGSKETVRCYRIGVRLFAKFLGFTPTELIVDLGTYPRVHIDHYLASLIES